MMRNACSSSTRFTVQRFARFASSHCEYDHSPPHMCGTGRSGLALLTCQPDGPGHGPQGCAKFPVQTKTHLPGREARRGLTVRFAAANAHIQRVPSTGARPGAPEFLDLVSNTNTHAPRTGTPSPARAGAQNFLWSATPLSRSGETVDEGSKREVEVFLASLQLRDQRVGHTHA